jgi:hypothetical protein
MNLFDFMEARAIETREHQSATINQSLLALIVIDEGMVWVLDGTIITPENARKLLEAVQ